MENLSTSGRELASGNRRSGETSGREASESLNEAILELRKSEQAMCQNPGSSGGEQSRSTAQRLGEAGEQQSQLNRETRSIAQRLSEQMRLSTGDRSELQRLSEQQQRIREQIEQIQRDDLQEQKLLGRLDEAQKDMKDVEEAIREGSNLGDLPEKQQRILSRLLDAQRSVHRRDFDPERESRTADDVPSVSAPELSPELLRQSDRLRMDLLKSESDRYPSQYRSFIEAYLRSLNGVRK
jgi:DNA repair exonuclease SbcCD ATPase subunit